MKVPCRQPGGEPGGDEWCRYYCLLNGSGRCHYDPETHRVMVEVEEDDS